MLDDYYQEQGWSPDGIPRKNGLSPGDEVVLMSPIEGG
jgi:hypothetical protein